MTSIVDVLPLELLAEVLKHVDPQRLQTYRLVDLVLPEAVNLA